MTLSDVLIVLFTVIDLGKYALFEPFQLTATDRALLIAVFSLESHIRLGVDHLQHFATGSAVLLGKDRLAEVRWAQVSLKI